MSKTGPTERIGLLVISRVMVTIIEELSFN